MKVKLGDIFEISSGGTPLKSCPEYYGGDIPWVKTGDLKSEYIYGVEDFITEDGLRNSSAKMYEEDTVLIAMYGATIGATSILKISACTNQACAAFIRNDKVIPEYLYYFLKSQKKKFVKDGVGGAQPNISAGYLKKVEMELLSIEEQRIVVDILDRITNIINRRNQELIALDNLIKARFVELFGFPGTDEKGWGLRRLGECCEINPKKVSDKRLASGMQVSFIPMTAVSENGAIKTAEKKTYDEVKVGFTYFAENDVLFAKITPCMENGKGAVAVGLCNGIGFGSTEFHVLRPINGRSNPYWLYSLISFDTFRKDAATNMTGSAGQRRVPSMFLEKYKITLPPFELQNQFADFVNQVDKSEFVERFPELFLFYRLFSPLNSEMICIFPYFCPYAESAREIRGIFVALHINNWSSGPILI